MSATVSFSSHDPCRAHTSSCKGASVIRLPLTTTCGGMQVFPVHHCTRGHNKAPPLSDPFCQRCFCDWPPCHACATQVSLNSFQPGLGHCLHSLALLPHVSAIHQSSGGRNSANIHALPRYMMLCHALVHSTCSAAKNVTNTHLMYLP